MQGLTGGDLKDTSSTHQQLKKIVNHFVNYVNFGQTFFATVRGYQWRFG